MLSLGASGEWHDLGNGHVEGEPNTGDVYPGPLRPGRSGRARVPARRTPLGYARQPGQSLPRLVGGGQRRRGAATGRRRRRRGLDALRAAASSACPAFFTTAATPARSTLPPTRSRSACGASSHPATCPSSSCRAWADPQFERGYIAGRWRDRASWVASIEHRFWLLPRGFPIPFTDAIRVERFGAALFYEAGAVADDFGSLFKSHVRSSYGFGIRATPRARGALPGRHRLLGGRRQRLGGLRA